MKALQRFLWVSGVLVFCFGSINAAPPVSTNHPAGFRLIVELQDGSKIIGKNGDADFQFRSDVLGEMKLPLERIRSIAGQSQTNSVLLTTVNGDTLTAQFVTRAVRVETAFGGVKLPVNLIRRLTVSPAEKPGPMREGLVALWRGEGDAQDVTGDHNGTITTQFIGNVSFSPGEVGTAFDFHGANFVDIQPIALTNCTIEFWCNQRTRTPKVSDTKWGSILVSDEVCEIVDDWSIGVLADGHLSFVMGDGVAGDDAAFQSTNVIPLNTFVHVAVTRSVVTGQIQIYLNGVLDGTFTAPHDRVMGIAIPTCGFPNTIGIGNLRREATLAAEGQGLSVIDAFDGLIDEPAIYDRVLSASEIQADYEAGKGGR